MKIHRSSQKFAISYSGLSFTPSVLFPPTLKRIFPRDIYNESSHNSAEELLGTERELFAFEHLLFQSSSQMWNVFWRRSKLQTFHISSWSLQVCSARRTSTSARRRRVWTACAWMVWTVTRARVNPATAAFTVNRRSTSASSCGPVSSAPPAPICEFLREFVTVKDLGPIHTGCSASREGHHANSETHCRSYSLQGSKVLLANLRANLPFPVWMELWECVGAKHNCLVLFRVRCLTDWCKCGKNSFCRTTYTREPFLRHCKKQSCKKA